MPKAKFGTAKKPAPAPFGARKTTKTKKNPLFESPRPKNFGIGQDIQPRTDLTRFVKWPENTTTQLFKLLNKYRPETTSEKKSPPSGYTQPLPAENKDTTPKSPSSSSSGLNHTVALIEAKASLVVIAHDVDPIELSQRCCRKMGVPYVIVKGKARLGTVVHKKIAAVLALQDVKSEDQRELATLVSAAKANFTAKYDEQRRQWGGGLRGNKSLQMLRSVPRPPARPSQLPLLASSERRL
ncbi:ribosomal protein L4 [Mycena galericulata]|nr:ribosomal protein L4 [Mycena galericulata]